MIITTIMTIIMIIYNHDNNMLYVAVAVASLINMMKTVSSKSWTVLEAWINRRQPCWRQRHTCWKGGPSWKLSKYFLKNSKTWWVSMNEPEKPPKSELCTVHSSLPNRWFRTNLAPQANCEKMPQDAAGPDCKHRCCVDCVDCVDHLEPEKIHVWNWIVAGSLTGQES